MERVSSNFNKTTNTFLEYIWLDAKENFRSKVRIERIKNLSEYKLPIWNYDGSSTGQGTTSNSEVLLYPSSVYWLPCNTRAYVICKTSCDDVYIGDYQKLFEKISKDVDPWFGMEQEFFMFPRDKTREEFLSMYRGQGKIQEDFYCSIGTDLSYHRSIIELVVNELLSLNITVTGYNYEVAPGQAEIQVLGKGKSSAYDLLLLRYLLIKRFGEHGLAIDLSNKPLGKKYNGSGCHVNFSTSITRGKGGLNHINKIIKQLSDNHYDHIKKFGKGNHMRLIGVHETSSFDKFTWGVASRNTSIRIPRETNKNQCGYFEDRRPGANMNPFVVLKCILSAALLCQTVENGNT